MPPNVFYSNGKRVSFPKKGELVLQKVLEDFDQFLLDKKHSYIQLEGERLGDGSLAVKRIPLKYSCDIEYRNEQLAKLYRLDDWYKTLPVNQRVVTMMTLTTHQKEFGSYFDQYDFIREVWLKLKDVMRLELGHFEYLVVAEPHYSGFVHYHILIFKWVTKVLAKRYQKLWEDKYGAGGSHGVNVSVNLSGSVRSLKNYLMKYLGKNFTLKYDEKMDKFNEYFPDSDLRCSSETIERPKCVTVEGESYFLKIFHAVKWFMNKRGSEYKGFRAFQPSRFLSQVMSLPPSGNPPQVAWSAVYLVIWGVSHLIRKIESPLLRWVDRSKCLLGPSCLVYPDPNPYPDHCLVTRVVERKSA